MKKKAFAAAAALAILSAALAPPFPGQTGKAEAAAATLAQGASGSAVSSLQQDLKTLGYFTYPTITGYYGPVTDQALRAFQQAYSLPVTGTADDITRIALSRAIVKKQILADANNYLRVPYLWGGATPAGFDCSGFIYFIYDKNGVSFPRTTSAAMATMGFSVDRDRLMPGDWVYFGLDQPGVVSHVGIYMGNGEFISATRSAGIYVQKLDSSYWGPKYLGARRYY